VVSCYLVKGGDGSHFQRRGHKLISKHGLLNIYSFYVWHGHCRGVDSTPLFGLVSVRKWEGCLCTYYLCTQLLYWSSVYSTEYSTQSGNGYTFRWTFHHERKISPGWWGWWVARPPPLSKSTITYKVVVYPATAETADTLSLFLLGERTCDKFTGILRTQR
jgi:hypothetical protein